MPYEVEEHLAVEEVRLEVGDRLHALLLELEVHPAHEQFLDLVGIVQCPREVEIFCTGGFFNKKVR